jgi:3-hydroxyacyl-[acyl-carrier-protein] dehydratase
MPPMDLLALLPHQPPMRLLDEVTDLRPGELAVARRVAHATDFYFQGHFPGDPIVPAVILVEMLAQAGGLAAGAPKAGDSQPPISLRVAGLGPFKFPAAARAGDVLEARARVVGQVGGLYKIEGAVTAAGRIVATGAVTLARVIS